MTQAVHVRPEQMELATFLPAVGRGQCQADRVQASVLRLEFLRIAASTSTSLSLTRRAAALAMFFWICTDRYIYSQSLGPPPRLWRSQPGRSRSLCHLFHALPSTGAAT